MLQKSRRIQWTGLIAVAFLVLGIGLFAPRVHAATPAQEPFAQALTDALVARDYAALAATAAPDISVVRWLGDRRMLSAADALAELQTDYLDPAAAPYVDRTTDLADWFGVEPTALWRDAASIGSVLFVRGLGSDGAGEALLGIGDDTLDAAQWSGLLLAEYGFGVPDARDANPVGAVAADAPAAVTEINILRTVNVYPEPNPDAAPVGLLRRNQTLAVQGVSADGDYFRIICPLGVAVACWVVNDPGSVAAVSQAMVDVPAVRTAPQATAAATASAAAAPERISFLEGEVSANRTGVVAPASPRSYMLRILGGQSLTVDLISGGNAANFSVIGAANGQPYKRIVNEARNWTFTVPVTQDYIIRIEGTVPTQYSLTVVVPALNLPPTSTPTPAPTTVSAERITFGRGETAAMRSGPLGAGQSKEYVIRVLGGQDVTTELYPTGSAGYTIVAADGAPIKRREVGGNTFTFTAPGTQDYRIRIAADEAIDYDFIITVPPLRPAPTATAAAPVRLSVPPGGTAVSVTEIVDPYGRDAYWAGASAGQTMYVSIQSPDAIANFSVVGVRDGQPLKRLENESRTWSGTLPATQDYLITVGNPRGVFVQYTLYVSFSPLEGNVPTATPRPSGPPQRIVFPAGATMATVSGSAPQSYVLRALGGQTMTVQLSPQGDATFSVSGSDGTVLKSSGVGRLTWSGVLPSNQDYTITVIPVSGSTAFALVVTVVF